MTRRRRSRGKRERGKEQSQDETREHGAGLARRTRLHNLGASRRSCPQDDGAAAFAQALPQAQACPTVPEGSPFTDENRGYPS